MKLKTWLSYPASENRWINPKNTFSLRDFEVCTSRYEKSITIQKDSNIILVYQLAFFIKTFTFSYCVGRTILMLGGLLGYKVCLSQQQLRNVEISMQLIVHLTLRILMPLSDKRIWSYVRILGAKKVFQRELSDITARW